MYRVLGVTSNLEIISIIQDIHRLYACIVTFFYARDLASGF